MIAFLGVLSGLSTLGLAAQAIQVGSFQTTQFPGVFETASAEAPMLVGEAAGWSTQPILTIGETYFGYQPVGLLDGLAAFKKNDNSAVVLANHELGASNGYAYTLANGTQLTGARVSSFFLTRGQDASGATTVQIRSAGLAYDTIYDRNGLEVVDPAQINETGLNIDGLARLCSSQGVDAGTFGFVDNLYFTGEENGKPFTPHGGTEWVLDVRARKLWAAPALGRAAWENVTPIETYTEERVALLLGDDSESAPLYLYVGQKNAIGDSSLLDRNGLAVGKIYAWKADSGDLTPDDWNGEGGFNTGSFVEVTSFDAAKAGQVGYDGYGWADIDTLQNEADALGCFSFSRPEDLATNPLDGTQAAFASTGRGSLFPADNWGTVYIVDVDVSDLDAPKAALLIVHDADGLLVPDEGIRNPDNLEWADDGKLYINEDRSTSPSSLFGAATGIEASVWQLDPITRVSTRIAVIDRSAVSPAGSTDSAPGDIGNWESSGVLDVTNVFPTLSNERLLIVDVQCHSVNNGPIGGNQLLGEAGQLLFLSKRGE